MEADVALMLWEMLIDVPDSNAKVSLVRRAELLDALAALDSATPRNRALILSYAVAGDGATERAHALSLCAAGPVNEMSQAIAAAGGAIDPVRVLAATQAILREAPWQLPDELPPSEAVEAELLAADDNLSSHLDDAQAQLRFGKAALLAARSRDALKVAGVETLLVDAQAALNKVVASSPKNSDAWLRLARVCYLSNDFAAEERAALGALAAAPELDASAVDRLLGRAEASAEQISLAARSLAQFKEQRMEALRWLADACARQLGNPWREDFAAEAANMARGLNAACLAALSPISNPTDWLTLSAYYAALGRRSEEISVARAGLDFFPDAQELRNAFYLAFWDRGYSAEARRQSEAIADRHADSAAARWYVGYAAMREGDTLRRAEDPKRAIAAYELADKAFQQSVQMSPSYQDSADFYRALAALGSGFAHLLVSERTQAVERLIAGIAIRPSIADVRDALDREAVDLLDGVLEWRGSGASPVDPTALATDFGRADPGNANWARRISDSELREGLRADGRNDAGLGDRYLQSSIASARIALAVLTDEAARRTLAQSLTVQAERLLARADFTAARPLLTEAASLVGERAPAAGSADGEWSELAARLRGQLGDARPVFRPGR